MPTEIKITERSATSLQWRADSKPYIVWDKDLAGFGVRVWGTGYSKAYVVQCKHNGRSFRETLGTVGQISAADAREAAISYKGKVKAGIDPRAEKQAAKVAWTLDDAMTYFRGDYSAARKLSDGHKVNCDAVYAHHTPDRWKTMKLSDISHGMIAARHNEITNGVTIKGTEVRGGATRANTWIALMSRLFTLGKARGHCLLNPCEGVKKNEGVHHERFLSPRELATLWLYLQKHDNVEAATCVQLILLTGCRPREAYTMKWDDLNLLTGVWVKPAPKTKRRKPQTLRLTDRTLAVLGRLTKRSTYVFPSPDDASQPRSDKLKAFWRATRKNCGLPDVRLYDVRHTAASIMAMNGASEFEIAAQLGHANLQTTKRYVHFAKEHLRAKADIIGADIVKALADYNPDQQPLVAEPSKDGTSVTQYLRDIEVTPEMFSLPELREKA